MKVKHSFTGILVRPKFRDLGEQWQPDLADSYCESERTKKETLFLFFHSHSHTIFPSQLKSISSRSREKKVKASIHLKQISLRFLAKKTG